MPDTVEVNFAIERATINGFRYILGNVSNEEVVRIALTLLNRAIAESKQERLVAAYDNKTQLLHPIAPELENIRWVD